ncbi:hypothetical protein D3C80_2176230 [compost metagenome]
MRLIFAQGFLQTVNAVLVFMRTGFVDLFLDFLLLGDAAFMLRCGQSSGGEQ